MGGPSGFWDPQTERHGQHTLEVDVYDSLGNESVATQIVNTG
jgi:hypothetical protein